jgi:hypothetical protein
MANAVTDKNPAPAVNQIFLLPLFYTFPTEVVGKSEFRDLPRNMHTALTDAESLERIQSKQFLKDMANMTAAMVWMHLGHKGWMEVYSGYSPAYVFAHMLRHWRNLFYTVYREVNPIELFQQGATFDWLSLEESKEVWARIVTFSDEHFSIVRKVIGVEKELPCFEDFDLKSGTARHSRAYYDFLRKWYHTKTKHPIMLTNRIPHRIGIWTNSADFRLDWESFVKSLEPAERKIIELKLQGKTQKEIAEIMGYKTHSAVQKKLVKIRKAYELWFHSEEE